MLKTVFHFLILGKGQVRQLEGKHRNLVASISLLTVLFHMAMLFRYYWGMDPLTFLWIHVGLVGALGFLIFSPIGVQYKITGESFVLAGLMIAITLYFLINENRLMLSHTLNYPPSNIDIWVGWLLIILLFEGLRRSIGPILAILVIAMGCYAWVEAEIKLNNMNRLLVYSGGTGAWGLPTSISANILVLIFVLAGLFESSGCGQLLLNLSSRLLRNTKGAAAKISVFGSGFFGAISGGAATNVAVTGVFTIPSMVKSGFKPAVAGAIESVASTGGAITPPIMGATIFVMAALVEIPYTTICTRAIPMTIIYFLILFLQSHLIAVRDGIGGVPFKEQIPLKRSLALGITLFVPLTVLVVGLYKKLSIGLALNISLVILIIMMFLTLGKNGWRQVIEGLIKGGYNAAYLVFVMVIVGIFMEIGFMSGLDMKLVGFIRELSGDYLYPNLILAALFSLILGVAGSILASYILVVMIVIPAIFAGTIEAFPAHMFGFYFGVMSYITPPICQACFVASRFCNATFWEIGWESLKLALPLWVMPFIFIYRPELLLMKGTPLEIMIAILIAMVGIGMLSVAAIGMGLTRLRNFERLTWAIVGILLIIPYRRFDIIGGVLTFFLVAWEILKWKKSEKNKTGSAILYSKTG